MGLLETLNERIRKAENERKDAIENGDRKGRWYAEGKIDAFKSIRISLSLR